MMIKLEIMPHEEFTDYHMLTLKINNEDSISHLMNLEQIKTLQYDLCDILVQLHGYRKNIDNKGEK